MTEFNSTQDNNKDYSKRVTEILSKIQEMIKQYDNSLSFTYRCDLDSNFFNTWADYWRYIIGVNVIRADGIYKRSYEEWKKYQHNPISEEQHEEWKRLNAFNKGMAIIPGRVWHNPSRSHLYFFALDIDNQLGIDELLSSLKAESLEQIAQKLLV